MVHDQPREQGRAPAPPRRPAQGALRNLTTDLLRYGRITTTMARAKAMRKPVEHMIQLGKDARPQEPGRGVVYDKELVAALFEQAPARYADRTGGYTRIVRTLRRRGDNAEMAITELVKRRALAAALFLVISLGGVVVGSRSALASAFGFTGQTELCTFDAQTRAHIRSSTWFNYQQSLSRFLVDPANLSLQAHFFFLVF